MKTKRYYVITPPPDFKPQPSDDEKLVARAMAYYLQSTIVFVRRSSSTTPDIEAVDLQQRWEIKNIRGNNKNTISRTLKSIYRQSENVIISLYRTNMSPSVATSRAKEKLSRANRIKRLVIITKENKIIVIK